MPTNKRRVTFIPSEEIFEILNTLAHNEEISLSRIACVLIEESLKSRGLVDYNIGFYGSSKKVNYSSDSDGTKKINDKNFKKVKYNSDGSYYSIFNSKGFDPRDPLVYEKFLKFLMFEEMLLANDSILNIDKCDT